MSDTANQPSALETALRMQLQKPLSTLSADPASAQTLEQVYQAQSQQVNDLEIQNAKLKLALQRVSAAAISALYKKNKKGILSVFSRDQLQEVVRVSAPLMEQGLQLETIYHAAWSLLDEQKTAEYTLH